MYKVLLYYKYVKLEGPKSVMADQMELCRRLSLKGRIILAYEGINGTLEGKSSNIKKYVDIMRRDADFGDIHFKLSRGDGKAFPKLSVKVRSEIVSGNLGAWELNPNELTGKYITAEQLHEWIRLGKQFYIVDMRNDYEQEVGHFEGSILPGLSNFRDIPKILPKLNHLRDKTIVTVCTGGVRCEKASGFLIKHGFLNVYQLFGGIVTYMEKYPGEDFLGALYVFDGRIVMSFDSSGGTQIAQDKSFGDKGRKVIGRCAVCKKSSENYINCRDIFCNRHFICCVNCAGRVSMCPMGCRDYSADPKYVARHGRLNLQGQTDNYSD